MNIGVALHYAPLHQMPLYRGDHAPRPLPLTEQVAKVIMTLPISASMSLEDAEYVALHLERLLR
jgi:dTDP-4-amino-4,6-dideoxygalactose transaminase